MTTTDRTYFDLLRQYDTPTVLNVIELFDVRPRSEGYLGPEIKALFPEMPPIVGYATTATFQSAEPPRSGAAYSGFVEQVALFEKEIPWPRIVVFQDTDPQPAGATFGEVMCSTYKAFGCVGLITSGAARDLDQVRRLGFPCWASGVIASHAYCRVVDVHVPVVVGGQRIEPGDVLHADLNGVAVIPGGIVAAVALGAKLFTEAEEEVLGYLRKPSPTADGLRDAQRRTREAAARIPERVRELVKR
jgi:regulator of RNase E activity RraA